MGVKIQWTNPTTYTDGTPYDQTDNAGYTLLIDGLPAISVPVAWATSIDLANISVYKTLKSGSHTVTVAVVSKEGVQSDYATPYTFQLDPRKPSPVSNFKGS